MIHSAQQKLQKRCHQSILHFIVYAITIIVMISTVLSAAFTAEMISLGLDKKKVLWLIQKCPLIDKYLRVCLRQKKHLLRLVIGSHLEIIWQ